MSHRLNKIVGAYRLQFILELSQCCRRRTQSRWRIVQAIDPETAKIRRACEVSATQLTFLTTVVDTSFFFYLQGALFNINGCLLVCLFVGKCSDLLTYLVTRMEPEIVDLYLPLYKLTTNCLIVIVHIRASKQHLVQDYFCNECVNYDTFCLV